MQALARCCHSFATPIAVSTSVLAMLVDSACSQTPDSFRAPADGYIPALAVQSDGKVLAGGSFATLAGKTRIGIARFGPDGTLEGTFNPGASNAMALLVQPGGNIVVGGYFTNLGGVSRSYIGRLNPNGSPDTAF